LSCVAAFTDFAVDFAATAKAGFVRGDGFDALARDAGAARFVRADLDLHFCLVGMLGRTVPTFECFYERQSVIRRAGRQAGRIAAPIVTRGFAP
jgi:hypothetical protein